MALNDPEAALYDRRGKSPADLLVRGHMTLVRKIAWHVRGRVSTAIDVEDLIQIGMIALIECARNYEDRGHAFASYATTRIRGSMIDALRRDAVLCRSAMGKKRAIAATRTRFEQAHGYAPSDVEMANAMNIDVAIYQADLLSARDITHQSIDELYSDYSMWFAASEDQADEVLERAQTHDSVADAIRTLPEREAMVLQLYFVEELNLEEIGATLNVGAARICQIKKSALDILRAKLG
jgi:RNA polymerase sigma factor FliA